ncbi:uncharacterized protein LOC128724426 [Anopheles nili]|uniref:uncharacterized protein LOC128724426 n=1 Tax=Anopheles nili TaxID=185578 RepID=UPI00237C391D|nr:uncharacterized protein LOC128724426 [Anopheles nili]
MERFSINILHQQVQNICRLCGVDNPDKVLILDLQETIYITDEEEPSLARKIEECVGIKVHKQDQMPQQICSLCVDKVNDFYEYRLMCASTNLQTRTILNLPIVYPSISLMKSEAPPEEDVKNFIDGKKTSAKRGPKTRNKKNSQGLGEACSSDQPDLKPTLEASTEKRMKYEYCCQYCKETYNQNSDLERHLVVKHTPLIHKFGCASCMEYFDTASEYKDHNLWHKLTRMPFGCFRCKKKFVKIGTLNKHVLMNACIRVSSVKSAAIIAPDLRCTLCKKVFKTRNLYEWHACFIRARANCPKCGKYFLKKNLLTRHYMLYCTGTLAQLEPILIPKDESSAVESANGVLNALTREGGKRRGRPSASARESMKVETMELPLSPLHESPDIKLETTTADGSLPSSEETFEHIAEGERKRAKASLEEETDKIAALLRSGASVDGNSDITTISNMLSSVNEAIASISKVRKKRKKKDRTDEVPGTANPPMVVLAMANIKQEESDDQSMLATLANCESVQNGLNADAAIPDGNDEISDYANDEAEVGESFADNDDGNTDNEDNDAAVGCASNRTPDLCSIGNAADMFPPDLPATSQEAEIEEELQPTQHCVVQMKQEPMTFDEDVQRNDESCEPMAACVVVKQEPLDEAEPEEPLSHHSDNMCPSSPVSKYQALRIKIKKEKGLLNASVIEGATSLLPTPPTENTLREPMNYPEEKMDTGMRIKQEQLDMDENTHREIDEMEACPDYLTSFDITSVRVKTESQDDLAGHCTAIQPVFDEGEPTGGVDFIAFDGTRIKQELSDEERIGRKTKAPVNGFLCSQNALRKSFNPLSLSIGRIIGSKSSQRPGGTSSLKSNVMINPFALMKQKNSHQAFNTSEDSSCNETSSLSTQSERLSLPVISQVKSINPDEHLSVPSAGTDSAVLSENEPTNDEPSASRSEESEQLQPSTLADSVTEEQTACNIFPPKSVSELTIASVTTIHESVQNDANEREDNSKEPDCQKTANEPTKSDDGILQVDERNSPEVFGKELDSSSHNLSVDEQKDQELKMQGGNANDSFAITEPHVLSVDEQKNQELEMQGGNAKDSFAITEPHVLSVDEQKNQELEMQGGNAKDSFAITEPHVESQDSRCDVTENVVEQETNFDKQQTPVMEKEEETSSNTSTQNEKDNQGEVFSKSDIRSEDPCLKP